MWKFFLILWFLIVLPAFGGTTYRFELTESDGVTRSETTGRVWVDGERSRVDFERDEAEPFTYDALIYSGPGGDATALNTELRTHYEHVRAAPSRRPGPRPRELGEWKVDFVAHEGAEEIRGFPCRKYTLTVAWVEKTDYGSEMVEQRFAEEHHIWATAEVAGQDPPAAVNAKDLVVSWPEISAEMTEKLLEVEGFPIQRRSSARQQYVGGAPTGSRSTLRLFDFEEVEIDQDKFEVPAGYRYAEPQILGPGDRPTDEDFFSGS